MRHTNLSKIQGRPLPIETAVGFAERICAELAPFCERGPEIAGSIRRRRPIPNDVDLVCIPRDLAGLKRRALANACQLCCGDQVFSIVCAGIRIDINFAHGAIPDLVADLPTNWGTLLLCKTGSLKHNIKLCDKAKDMGLHWNPAHGLYDGENRLLASETEESIFSALDLPYIPPEARE